jgi:hypothetical protein
MTTCEVSGKHVIIDETAVSLVTGRRVAASGLRRSAFSGKVAEPEHFGLCEFTGQELLLTELRTSNISGKHYREDESGVSALSGRVGHKSEFIDCHETRASIASDEAERCEATGALVRPGVLITCGETGVRVLPSETRTSSVSAIRARKELFVVSSVSGDPLLEREGVGSSSHAFCKASEAVVCEWGGKPSHPDDVVDCALTGLLVRREYLTRDKPFRLDALQRLLDGRSHDRAFEVEWEAFSQSAGRAPHTNKIRIEGAIGAPTGDRAAVVGEVRTLLGLRVRQVGFVIDASNATVHGRVRTGKRNMNGWTVD